MKLVSANSSFSPRSRIFKHNYSVDSWSLHLFVRSCVSQRYGEVRKRISSHVATLPNSDQKRFSDEHGQTLQFAVRDERFLLQTQTESLPEIRLFCALARNCCSLLLYATRLLLQKIALDDRAGQLGAAAPSYSALSVRLGCGIVFLFVALYWKLIFK